MAIPATNPIVTPAVGSVTYNEWYLTQLSINATPDTCPTSVTLRRAATDDNGVTTLMPAGTGSRVSFNVDVFKELQDYPAFATAMEAVVEAVVAYATAKNLL